MSEKSFIDNLFDVADAALSPVESVLSREPAPRKKPDAIDAEFRDHPTTDAHPNARHDDWEKTFSVTEWACVGTRWHAFPEGSMSTLCNPDSSLPGVASRGILKHDQFITACTSCIIAVSK